MLTIPGTLQRADLEVAISKYRESPGSEAANEVIDCLHACLALTTSVEIPLEAFFTNGLYSRRVILPKDSMTISAIHATEHQFFVMSGAVIVWSENEGCVTYVGPCHGVTTPGTRRVLMAIDDTVWVTIHPNPDNERDVDKLMQRLTIEHTNKRLCLSQ